MNGTGDRLYPRFPRILAACRRGGDRPIYDITPTTDSENILDIFPNAGRIIKAWDGGKVGQEIHETGCNTIRAMEVHKYDGKYVTEVNWARNEFEHDIIYAGH
ncbi:hypothetical protein BKA56DRAFT_672197 [Ilyonectria sp. MPI-CAGE-AT-0026]|nr:hypothetical protein BKA56DRAFT_672197 [Ilyonectria sp. MPI-CAGE-AT-0026]